MPSGEFDGSNRDYYFQVAVASPRLRQRKNRRWLERNIGSFLQQYARTAPRGKEPNDRRYDSRVAATVKRLRPEELDRLRTGPDDCNDEAGA
jgi:hypothetical protein